jgi:hypothetical protein
MSTQIMEVKPERERERERGGEVPHIPAPISVGGPTDPWPGAETRETWISPTSLSAVTDKIFIPASCTSPTSVAPFSTRVIR